MEDAMDLAEGIRRRGFRKWYEGQLLQSHLHMLLLLFCTIGLLGAFEVFDRAAAPGTQLSVALSALFCVGVGVLALRRYLFLLMHAEAAAHQAVCTGCGAYGRLELLPTVAAAKADVPVRCKRCGHSWSISD